MNKKNLQKIFFFFVLIFLCLSSFRVMADTVIDRDGGCNPKGGSICASQQSEPDQYDLTCVLKYNSSSEYICAAVGQVPDGKPCYPIASGSECKSGTCLASSGTCAVSNGGNNGNSGIPILDNLNSAGTQVGLHATPIPTIVGKLIKIFLGLVGIILLILIVYGGALWAFSAGNEESVKKARSIIFNAVIGLAIVFLAYALSSFIIQKLQMVSAVS